MPTLTYEHPVAMDIPVKGSWVGHLDGVDNASIVPQVTGYLQTPELFQRRRREKGGSPLPD